MALSRRRLFVLLSAVVVGVLLAFPLKVLSTQQPIAQAAVSEPSVSLDLFQAIVLGAVQGLTEFLPISSTAHLKVVPVMLGWGDPGVAFSAVIQLGSIIAVLWYFRQDLMQITTGAWKAVSRSDYDSKDFQLALGIILGTLPIVFFGVLLKILVPDYDNSPLRSLVAIAVFSIGMALLLGLAERLGQRKRKFDDLDVRDGIWMGLAQALALLPGVSRSGSTLTAGLFMGIERAATARFSFLLGIPAIILAGLVQLKDALNAELGSGGLISLAVGVISAAIFSYAAIAWLLRFLQTQNTWIFVWYRLVFGVGILIAIAAGMLPNS